jgi:ATP-dependent protease ClpP protease subunit/DNA-directed RNA polymerase subunit F
MKLSYRTQANAQTISKIYNKPLDKPEWFSITAAPKNQQSEIFIFDYIGWPYNDPLEIIRSLEDMGDVLVRIHSPGGDVFDGASIMNSLSSHAGGVVTIRVEGLAASMAGTIATVGKKVQAYKNAMFMYHNAWTVDAGNQYELRDTADLLEKIDNNILAAYQGKTKKGKKELAEMMKNTTWMTAQEAKDYGFVDEIIDGKSVKAEFELSMYANIPDTLIFQDVGKDLSRKEFERALRNAGASRSYAKMAASLVAAERSNEELLNQRNVDEEKEAKRLNDSEEERKSILAKETDDIIKDSLREIKDYSQRYYNALK